MIARFKTTSGDCASHIGPSLHFDKGGAEDAMYESLSPKILQGMPVAGSPANNRMAILQKSQQADARMPGFAYWLLVLLVAASTFWICGGYVLFNPPYTAKPHVSGSTALAPSQQRYSTTGH